MICLQVLGLLSLLGEVDGTLLLLLLSGSCAVLGCLGLGVLRTSLAHSQIEHLRAIRPRLSEFVIEFLPIKSLMTDEEILAEFDGKFVSQEIKDADDFEANAKQFEAWFVKLHYDFIQPHFDKLWMLVRSIATHYRPPVQQLGSNCLYTLVKESAPAQIKKIAPQLREDLNKLVQVGHTEVMPDLVPVITKAVPFIYEDASSSEFHEFFMHYLETWGRDKTSEMAGYVFASQFGQIMPFLGMCAARYIRSSLSVIERRLKFLKSRNHIRQYLAAVQALCEQTWCVIGANETEVNAVVNMALENGQGDELIQALADRIREILQKCPSQPRMFS